MSLLEETQIVKLSENAQVRAIVRAAFPDYRKLKVCVDPFHPMNINSYWDGGSKHEYAFVDVATLRAAPASQSSHPYFDIERRGLANRDGGAITTDHVGNVTLHVLPMGAVLVRAGTFCGKPATAWVYYEPASRLALGDGKP